VNGSWTVRRSATGHAGSWATVDTFKTTEWTQASARSIVATASGALHVAGWGYSSKNVSAITEDAAGNLFVCGQAADSAGKLWWLVRNGVPGTTSVKQGGKWITMPTVTWSNNDAYQLATGQPAQANGLTVDSTGAVFASGRAANAAGVNQWIVRKLVQ
jgi:hypothetical protein